MLQLNIFPSKNIVNAAEKIWPEGIVHKTNTYDIVCFMFFIKQIYTLSLTGLRYIGFRNASLETQQNTIRQQPWHSTVFIFNFTHKHYNEPFLNYLTGWYSFLPTRVFLLKMDFCISETYILGFGEPIICIFEY